MKLWEALRETMEHGAWIARASFEGHGRGQWRYAYRWDGKAQQWLCAAQHRPGDRFVDQWSRPALPLGELLMGWTWEIVEVET